MPSVVAGSQALILNTSTGTLHGTLETPNSPTPVPAILLLSGGIPIDRDGNSHLYPDSNNTIKLLAEALQRQGIATLRYDKRAVKASRGACRSEEELRTEVYVQDALAWGKKLVDDKRFASVFVLGHGESSLIGILTARTLAADGFISLAGLGRPKQDILREQGKTYLPADLFQGMQQIISSLEQGKRIDSLPHFLFNMHFRPGLQPYMMSMFRYDPAKELAKLSVPSLVLCGTKDTDCPPSESKILASGSSLAKLSLVENMNHLLREYVPPEQLNSPQAKSRNAAVASPIMPKVIAEIAEFVRVNTMKKKLREAHRDAARDSSQKTHQQ